MTPRSRSETARTAGPLVGAGVFLAALAVLGFRLGAVPLMEPDEARYAAVGQTMWGTQDFVTPRVNGFVYLDKPPLLHWLTALSIGAFGPREFAVRLGSLVAAAAGVALVFAFGRQASGQSAGLISALVLAASVLWFAVGRVIRYDMLLTVCLTATVWWGWLGSERGRDGRRYYVYAAAAAGLGVLVKGPVALALPMLILLPYLALTRRLRALLEVPWVAVLALLAAIVVPWFALCEHANPGAARFFLLHENVARVKGEIDESHHQPWWYLGPVLLGACLPWTLLLPGAAWCGSVTRKGADEPQRRACLLWLLWLLMPVLVFSLSKVKVVTYILPSLPPAALLIGRYFAAPGGGGRWPLLATGVILAAIGAALPALQPQLPDGLRIVPLATALAVGGLATVTAAAWRKPPAAVALLGATALVFYHLAIATVGNSSLFPSDRALVRRAEELRRPGERIYCVRKLSRGAAFYLDERVAVFGATPAEYDFPGNADDLEGWVYPLEEARPLLSSRPALILCRNRFEEEFLARAGDSVVRLADTGRGLIFRSVPASASDQGAGDPPP